MAFVRDDVADAWRGLDPLTEAFALDGEVYRDVPGRRTLKVAIGERTYFAKLHYGVGWLEIFKNWVQLKKPVVGAANEYLACVGLHEEGITAPVPAAFAESADNVAQRRSFVLCDELAGYVSLEDVTEEWFDEAPSALTKHRLPLRGGEVCPQVSRSGFRASGLLHLPPVGRGRELGGG